MAEKPDTMSLSLKGMVRCVGMVKGEDKEGTPCYQNVILTIKEGRVTAVEKLHPAYTQDEAINFATGWIDQEYWRE